MAELLAAGAFEPEALFCTAAYALETASLLQTASCPLFEVSQAWLEETGTLQTNEAALAIVRMRPPTPLTSWPRLCFFLDDLRDPGNVGTIIRLCDWYGLDTLLCTETTADFYNPKVISATMGSFNRVKVLTGSLEEWLGTQGPTPRPYVMGAFMEGMPLYEAQPPAGRPLLLVIGNEAQGIGEQTARLIDQPITIPRRGRAESLNAAIATAIIADHFAGRMGAIYG